MRKKGYTLVELIIYIAVLVLVIGVCVSGFIVFQKTYIRVQTHHILNASAAAFLQRITYDIQDSTSIDTTASTFNSDSGELVLLSGDPGSPQTLSYAHASSTILIEENGVVEGSLIPDSVMVTRFRLDDFTNGAQTGVRIELSLTSSRAGYTASSTFYTSAFPRTHYDL